MNTNLLGSTAYQVPGSANVAAGAKRPATTPSTLFDALNDQDKVSISDQGQLKNKQQALLSGLSLLQQAQSLAKSQGDALRKAAARERIEMLKRQMDIMRSMLAGLDPHMAKAMLGQLKQIAQELKQAAAVLSEGGAGESSAGAGQSAALPVSTTPVVVSSGEADGGQAAAAQAQQAQQQAAQQAEQQAQQQAEQQAEQQAREAQQDAGQAAAVAPSTTQVEAQANALARQAEPPQPGQPAAQPDRNSERANDAELIRTALRKLKQLLAAVKTQLKPSDELKKTERLVQAVENIAEQLSASDSSQTAGDAGAVAGVSVHA